MGLEGVQLSSTILGAIATGSVVAVFKLVSYFFVQKDKTVSDTLTTLIGKIEAREHRDADFREEWGGFKKELQMISASAMIVKTASEEIIILRRNIETAFKRVDELKSLSLEMQAAIDVVYSLKHSFEAMELSMRSGYKTVLGRLNILKESIENNGGSIDNKEWLTPNDHDHDLKG
jgi:hypothetical protein